MRKVRPKNRVRLFRFIFLLFNLVCWQSRRGYHLWGRLVYNFEFSINDISVNSHLIITRLLSNCSELKCLLICFGHYFEESLKKKWKLSLHCPVLSILNCHFEFVIPFLNAPMSSHFQLFNRSYLSHFSSHFHKVITTQIAHQHWANAGPM